MNDKQVVISSYSDLSKLAPNIRKVHFRKFISKKLLDKVLLQCPKMKNVSFSNYASKRLNDQLISFIIKKELKIEHSNSDVGRPNLLEKF